MVFTHVGLQSRAEREKEKHKRQPTHKARTLALRRVPLKRVRDAVVAFQTGRVLWIKAVVELHARLGVDKLTVRPGAGRLHLVADFFRGRHSAAEIGHSCFHRKAEVPLYVTNTGIHCGARVSVMVGVYFSKLIDHNMHRSGSNVCTHETNAHTSCTRAEQGRNRSLWKYVGLETRV